MSDVADRFILDPDERRILGVLIEKSLSTPQYYPLTVNAMVTGSNQKSNRDPYVEFVDDEVEEILVRLQRRGLVTEHYGAGGRAARWRQEFTYELDLDGPQMAVVGELLLRGPQTLGELRTRASRMKKIPDLGALETVVAQLTALDPPRMVRLTPEGRKRGARYTHGFYPAEELETLLDAEEAGAPAPAPRSAGSEAAAPPGAITALHAQIVALEERIVHLERQLGVPSKPPGDGAEGP